MVIRAIGIWAKGTPLDLDDSLSTLDMEFDKAIISLSKHLSNSGQGIDKETI